MPEDITYMVLPRMAALSEVLWSPVKSRNWENFYDRLPAHFERYKALGINYSMSVNQIKVEKIQAADSVIQLNLKTEVPNGMIYYTTNGSTPDTLSARFDQPFDLAEIDLLKMQLYRNGQKVGDIQQRAISVSADK
jgi:hexosaminidase